MPTIEDQIRLELEMLKYGAERYHQARERMVERGKESQTKYGRAIAAASIDQVAEAVKELQTAASNNRDIAKKKVGGMNPFEVSYITLVVLIDSLARSLPLLKMAKLVGGNIEMQDRIDKWMEADPVVAKTIVKQAQEKTTYQHARAGLVHKMNKDGHEDDAWSEQERIHVGVRLIDCVIKSTALFQTTKIVTGKGKTTTYIKATDQTLEWIRAFNEQAEAALPRYAPSIIKPKPWTDVWGGGYYSEQIQQLPIVRAH